VLDCLVSCQVFLLRGALFAAHEIAKVSSAFVLGLLMLAKRFRVGIARAAAWSVTNRSFMPSHVIL